MDCMAFKFRNFLAFKKSLEIFYNKLFVWIEFKFVSKFLLNHATWGGQKNMGCAGFKLRQFW